MEITSATAIDSAPAPKASSSGQALGKEQFLQLLIAQLSNQDPTNPLDDKAFIAQLAQFSALEQSIAMNQGLSMLQLSQSAMVNAQMAGLVGKQVTVRSQSVELPASGEVPGISLRLAAPAASVQVRVIDASGKVVRTLDLGARDGGLQATAWDGMDDAGKRLPAGTYALEIQATDEAGLPVATENEIKGLVTGIAFDSGSAELVIGSIRVRPANVVSIENP